MQPQFKISLLGTPSIRLHDEEVRGFRSSKAQALLYYLVATDRAHSRTTLAGLFWGDVAEQHARRSLTSVLSNLRKLFPRRFDITRETVAFVSHPTDQVDVTDFVSHCAAQELTSLQQAVALYRGEFLAELYLHDAPDFEQWLLIERTRYREMQVHALTAIADLLVTQEELDDAILYLRQILELEPWREEVHRHLMLILAQRSQRGAALSQYETCKQILAAELAVAPGEETEMLIAQIRNDEIPTLRSLQYAVPRGQASTIRDWHSPSEDSATQQSELVEQSVARPSPRDQARQNLASYRRPFVGRQADLADLQQRLHDPRCRLITLVGPGGIGKTSLALAAAEAQIAHRPDGVYFVALQSVALPTDIPAAIAHAIGCRFYSNMDPRDQLTDYLRPKEMLLVLDNFEHLLEGASLVSHLLTHAEGLQLIATSREPLRIQEEWFHPLTGLRFPHGETDSETATAHYDAVALFVQCARRASVNFSLLTEWNDVVRICRLVDGMPLGIELAAAWRKMLSCAQIAEEITHGLDILTARHNDVPERHRSMRVVLEQSWQLLTEDAQRVLRRLSVFPGSFEQNAAMQVAEASLWTMADLIEKALVRVVGDERYQIHELLRQFAEKKLVEDAAEERATRSAHSHYYLNFVNQHDSRLTGRGQAAALQIIEREIDNITLAWRWAATTVDVASLAQALDGLYLFLSTRSHYQSGADLFALAVMHCEAYGRDHPDAVPMALIAKLVARLGAFQNLLAEFALASESLSKSLREHPEPLEQIFLFNTFAEVYYAQTDLRAAETAAHKALHLSRTHGDLAGEALALFHLAEITASGGQPETGKEWAEASLMLCRQLERPDWMINALAMLAWCYNALGAYERAEGFFREALMLCEEIGNRAGAGLMHNHLAWTELCIGGERLPAALPLFEEARSLLEDVGHRRHLAMCLADYAHASLDLQRYEDALRLSRAGRDIAAEGGMAAMLIYCLASMGAAVGHLGDHVLGRHYFLEAFNVIRTAGQPDLTIYACFRFAEFLMHETVGMSDERLRVARLQFAADLLKMIETDPHGWPHTRAQARERLRVLEEQFDNKIASTTPYALRDVVDQIIDRILN